MRNPQHNESFLKFIKASKKHLTFHNLSKRPMDPKGIAQKLLPYFKFLRVCRQEVTYVTNMLS